MVAETGWFPCCGVWEPELECGAGSVGRLVCAQLTFTHSLSVVCVSCDVDQKLRTSPAVLSEVWGAGRAGQEVLSAQIRGIAFPHRPKAHLFMTKRAGESPYTVHSPMDRVGALA